MFGVAREADEVNIRVRPNSRVHCEVERAGGKDVNSVLDKLDLSLLLLAADPDTDGCGTPFLECRRSSGCVFLPGNCADLAAVTGSTLGWGGREDCCECLGDDKRREGEEGRRRREHCDLLIGFSG